jgi:hypothetical protein
MVDRGRALQSDFENHVNFTHDFNPGNGPPVSAVDSGNGFGAMVFWVAVIADGDVTVNPGAGRAEMHVHNLPEPPDGFGDLASLGPTWQTGHFDSTVSFDVVWNGPVTRRVNVRDAANGFAGQFNENQATVTWSANSASFRLERHCPYEPGRMQMKNDLEAAGRILDGRTFRPSSSAAAPGGLARSVNQRARSSR